MKRAFLFIVAIILTVTVTAGDITPEQALQQARKFIEQQEAAGSRVRRQPGTLPQLTMTRRVSGLYVFNVADDGGFVIVSGDDRTKPVLGYSDSGSIDPDRMPSNMRAWLQGYADEIAWLQEQLTQRIPAPRRPLMSKPSRRVGSHSTAAIAPLVTTTWNQGTPYNNKCPKYDGSHRAVTGCVATAMAQVMNYHQWPQSATTAIPGYTSSSYGLSLSALPAVTFNWSNMKSGYKSGYTTAQANAVATLMQYCGYSVEMDYGPESGSNSYMVANALKAYFDYNETTQVVSRSLYTAAKWTDLIYHELAHGRPVVYGGMSTIGGHEFVCDGYKYDGGDLFHINWGWEGTSDGYFVLSALDPDEQGIGGSSSNDGFNSGQDAVIGIQPSTGTGSIANISPYDIDNLTLNSMTAATNPAIVNVPVNITLNITNSSTDDYEGEVYLGRKNSEYDYDLLVGGNYTIAAGETSDIVIPFTPDATGTYDLVLFLPNDQGSYSTNCRVYLTLNVISASEAPLQPPYSLAASEITSSGAVLTWSGNQDSYNVRYREAQEEDVTWVEDFENGLGNWTIYTEGETGGSNGWVITNPTNGLKFDAHSGSYVASSWSWNGDAYNADNWLVSPALRLNGKLKFWVRTHRSYPDSYEVKLSTAGNTVAAFTNASAVTLQAMAPAPTTGDWAEVVIDLSAYAGTTGYIAIHHVSYDCNYLLIDDFGIYCEQNPVEWITATSTTESVSITGLTPDTQYEWQVQGVCPDCQDGVTEWSAKSTFTTSSSVTGDANGDGDVDIADVTAIINYINGTTSDSFNPAAADANGDGTIDIGDVTAVINTINQ